MTEHNAHIGYLPSILKEKGIAKVIISPGSRNAPLIQVFTKVFRDTCISIVDERSAAYYGLGMALKSQKPVVIVSTSGTAVLNFAPAIAEAFFQKVPLIVITADRPPEWLDMQDNQTIHQNNIFSKNIKKSYTLPVATQIKDEIWHVQRIVNQLYNEAISGGQGPVHLNVPLREPLYNDIEIAAKPKIIAIEQEQSISLSAPLRTKWAEAGKIMIVAGQSPNNENINQLLEKLSKDKRILILAESIANIHVPHTISRPDCIKCIEPEQPDDYIPDLVVYFGGQVVSKDLKKLLRNSQAEQWYISPEAEHVDTYQNLTAVIKTTPQSFFQEILKLSSTDAPVHYRALWAALQDEYQDKLNNYLKQAPFCDLTFMGKLTPKLKEDDIVFVGNSSIIRYFQMFKNSPGEIYANRGTSGIDGCLSTAAGIATLSDQKVICLLGDMGFLYDSNALWNKRLPPNLKIIVINNGGGNIFGMINGPGTQESYSEYFLAHHPVHIQKLSEAYGVGYYKACNMGEVEQMYPDFYKAPSASILEVVIPTEANTGIFNKLVNKLNSRYEQN